MSKSVFVMDMPEKCECGYCEIYESCRQRWNPCPLKPLPSKITAEELDSMGEDSYNYGYFDGYNRCLSMIYEPVEEE